MIAHIELSCKAVIKLRFVRDIREQTFVGEMNSRALVSLIYSGLVLSVESTWVRDVASGKTKQSKKLVITRFGKRLSCFGID